MEFLELVSKRESVRKYTGENVKISDLEKIVQAGRLSPSACNSQPWSYIVVSGGKTLENLKKAVQYFGTNGFTEKAGALIVILGEKSSYPERVVQAICGRVFSDIDIGITVANMALEATSLELGTCILGGFNEAKVKTAVGISEKDKRNVKLVLAVGVPENTTPREKNRKQLTEIAKFINE